MLLGKYPLATIWLYCRSVAQSVIFYRDILGIRVFDEGGGTAHLDAGGVRLSLHPADPEDTPARGSFFVFLVQDSIESVYDELVGRGVHFQEPLQDFFYGRVASFYDPDGHQLFIWQPPSETDARFSGVAALVHHHNGICARLFGQPVTDT